jgi:hypothetical protein
MRETAPSLTKMFRRCRLTVASVSESRVAIWLLLRASPTRASTSRSRADSDSASGPGWFGCRLSRLTPSTTRSASVITVLIVTTSSCQWVSLSR